MKIVINCSVELVRISPVTFTFRSEQFEVEALRIFRTPTSLHSSRRHYYTAEFVAPNGVIGISGKSITGELIRAPIIRRCNPKWRPPKDGWNGNIWSDGRV
ncbi:hypothetical protein D3C76_1467370 [compost metagenome]